VIVKKLRDIMRPEFLTTIPSTSTVADAVRAMVTRNVGIVAVLDCEQLVGVVSERDVVRRVVDQGRDPARTPVIEVMTTELVVADADEPYQAAMRKMDQANIRHLPVVSGGRLLAMLSIRDLVRIELEDRGDELRYLHAYLFQVPPVVGETP
jgi:CBS domain-containing protein